MIVCKKYYVDTTEQVDCLPVTHEIHYAIRDAGIAQGMVTITIPAPEASVVIGEAVLEVVEALRVVTAGWLGQTVTGAAKDAKLRPVTVAARVQSALLGRAVTLPFDQHRLLLDPYSDVLLVDFEPKRQRREVVITVVGDTAAAGGKP